MYSVNSYIKIQSESSSSSVHIPHQPMLSSNYTNTNLSSINQIPPSLRLTFLPCIYFGFTSVSVTYRINTLGSGIGSGGDCNSSRYEQAMANTDPS